MDSESATSAPATGETAATTEIKIPALFEDPSADVILRTSDGVDLRVYKLILSLSSPVFQTMLTLPQPPSDNTSTPTNPVIGMTEPSSVLIPLIRACYPARREHELDATDTAHPGGQTASGKPNHDLIREILEAARKYDIAAFDSTASALLHGFIEGDPIAVYATAARFSLKSVAAAAAKQTLKSKFMTHRSAEAMNYMTPVQLYDLLQYHRRCGEAAHDAINHFARNVDEEDRFYYMFTDSKPCSCFRRLDMTMLGDDDSGSWALPSVWDFLQYAAAAAKDHPDPQVILSYDEIQAHPRWEGAACSDYDNCAASGPMSLEPFYAKLMKMVTEAVNKEPPPSIP
ncbi:uncharacterized protein STEHIDRAFT_156748 [Stereum hirsutum FP-91666 SS1]|uniref:uncharacterized protein n=1 Tax=Stereum hirsutum (strain FP-91666) TaxID=721885 RepID=UPI000440F6C7|nr:uncharacterized protein STEHIDRAFT_156748 [Stereum hirsutum FP-91666 SS1]EIM86434.1 hypothetical protein STEHIDRAFT_156748 [Stereum hirsutum FP-91666 SS1]